MYHCIAVDLPGHGESIGFTEEQHTAINVIDILKVVLGLLHPFFDIDVRLVAVGLL